MRLSKGYPSDARNDRVALRLAKNQLVVAPEADEPCHSPADDPIDAPCYPIAAPRAEGNVEK